MLEKLRGSLINSKEEIETKGLEQLIKNTSDPNDAIELVKKFKMDKQFTSAVTEFEKSKTTINFKIDIVKFIEKCPRMKDVFGQYFLLF